MMNTQANVAIDKQKRPEKYCPAPRCLWRTGGGHCPRHAPKPQQSTVLDWIRNGCTFPGKVA